MKEDRIVLVLYYVLISTIMLTTKGENNIVLQVKILRIRTMHFNF